MDMVSDRYIHKIQDILLLLSIVVFLCMIPGCGYRQASDSYLAEVDSIIEQRPDSALMLLESIQPSPSASDYDRAYYNMLLTYARYKNFIDETNDSVIADAAEYFLEHRESEQASCSLFLKGMIQMNSNRLGQAAVSFKKGLDIAREGSHYMWEGQCARGLFFLFG
ncbi:MAG: hypothetical protein K2F93_04750, partial [Muribaculaceae bacterium]|nr:hypothetical protein [Muribaculaceae bacterium]